MQGGRRHGGLTGGARGIKPYALPPREARRAAAHAVTPGSSCWRLEAAQSRDRQGRHASYLRQVSFCGLLQAPLGWWMAPPTVSEGCASASTAYTCFFHSDCKQAEAGGRQRRRQAERASARGRRGGAARTHQRKRMAAAKDKGMQDEHSGGGTVPTRPPPPPPHVGGVVVGDVVQPGMPLGRHGGGILRAVVVRLGIHDPAVAHCGGRRWPCQAGCRTGSLVRMERAREERMAG